MKLKSVLVGVVVAGLCVSAAVAAPPPGKGKPSPSPGTVTSSKPKPGKGKPSKTGDNCKPRVAVVLKGTVDSASAGSLKMDVTHSNRWGRAWVEAGSATLTVDEDTKVRRNGNKTLAAQTRPRRMGARAGPRVPEGPSRRRHACPDGGADRRASGEGVAPARTPDQGSAERTATTGPAAAPAPSSPLRSGPLQPTTCRRAKAEWTSATSSGSRGDAIPSGGIDPDGVEPRLVYLEDASGRTISIPFAELLRAALSAAPLHLVEDDEPA